MPGAPDPSVIEQLRAASARMPDVDLVVLYGSTAAGTAHPASDVDVAVGVSDATPDRRRQIEVAFLRTSASPVDVLFLDEAPPQVRFEVARTGSLVFERIPGLWVRERVRAMVDWWDWAPIARRLHAAGVSRLRREAREW
ncbi:MAG TPA: nucleotidyltransferase domain-containing protein [Vicinamibacterales bacterium]|nr:nucleotidyltransferase domain-containing protein [Vicinamibacterales bacterium]